jgi:hypothetical protein
MRAALLTLTTILALPAQAQDTADPAMMGMPPGIMFNTSISINSPLMAADATAKAAEEDAYRKSLYARSVSECATLLEAIAKTCTITAVNVSTQINTNPGQPDYLYATANISMQVELK